jgi:predicted dehydrogenase
LLSLQQRGINPRAVADLEEVLADPIIDAVIVAGIASVRAAQLRRALQSDCHVVCVHPAGPSPDVAYEAALIQGDTGRVLLPLLPMTPHPAFARVADVMRSRSPRVVELEVWSVEDVFVDDEFKVTLPGWDALRFLGGEITEVYLQSPQADLQSDHALLAIGRFASGILFQSTYIPAQAEARWRLSLVTTTGRSTLLFAQGFPGPAEWTCTTDAGEPRADTFPAFDPWTALLERFEQTVRQATIAKPIQGRTSDECLTKSPPVLGWQDELRALELDDACRRSAERGRSSTLDLQETTEEASFKGTMTLVGCSLIWLTIAILILAIWVHQLAWLIVPLFAIFLGLQALRWIVPKSGG